MLPLFAFVVIIWSDIVLGQTGQICPNGWERYESSCYHFQDELFMDWTAGTHYCSAHHQSNLAVIDSREEDLMLTDHLQKLYKPGSDHNVWFWLGATDDEIEGLWKWYTDDRTFSRGYVNWHSGEPTNNAKEDCLCYFGSMNFAAWADHLCDTRAHVICEKNFSAPAIEVIG